MTIPAPSINIPAPIAAQLAQLHAQSTAQEAQLNVAALALSGSGASFDAAMRDKFIALDADKSAFMYQLLRALNATNVVEAGTSFGVSTMYLALAVGQNSARAGGNAKGVVIATENEPEKAKRARAHWKNAGPQVEDYVQLREGDLRETLKEGLPEVVDLLLLDIWPPMALPALELVLPKMRPGAVVLVDNTAASGERYADLLGFLRAPGSPFSCITLPYKGGLDMCVYHP